MNVKGEKDLERVRTVALLALSENARLTSELVRTKREILLLKGATAEQLQQELQLLDQKLAKDAAAFEKKVDDEAKKRSEPAEKKPRKQRERSGSRPEQKSLRVVDVPHDLDEADRACGECGGALAYWEGQDDVTEEVDVITREFVIKKHTRRKYRCKCGEGLVIDSQTLWDQVHALASRLAPAHERLREQILTEKVIGMDQSPWKVLGHAKSWQMWTLTTTTLCYFDICKSKGEEDGRRVLGSFAGTIIGDAATTHAALSSPTLWFAHCWAHVIRRAKDLSTSDPLRSAQLVKMIQQLYEIDAEAGDDNQRRHELRGTKSRKIVDDIYAWRVEQRPLPSSPTAQVLGYLDNQKAGLKRFLDDPCIPLDNNQSEPRRRIR